jgi:predicted O-methyltransferase YrrM
MLERSVERPRRLGLGVDVGSRFAGVRLPWGGRAPEQHSLSARHVEPSLIASIDDLRPGSNDFLVGLLLEAAAEARSISLEDVVARCSDPMDALYTTTWPGEHYKLLAGIARVLNAKHAVEVGTYKGQGTLALASAVPKVVTYDVVAYTDIPGALLRPDDFDHGVEQRLGDLCVPEFFDSQLDTLLEADLIFVDGPKDGHFEKAFSELLYPALVGTGKLVVWDDIRLMSMVSVWRGFPVAKLDATSLGHWSGTGLTQSI